MSGYEFPRPPDPPTPRLPSLKPRSLMAGVRRSQAHCEVLGQTLLHALGGAHVISLQADAALAAIQIFDVRAGIVYADDDRRA
jgi:hypothetical protein